MSCGILEDDLDAQGSVVPMPLGFQEFKIGLHMS